MERPCGNNEIDRLESPFVCRPPSRKHQQDRAALEPLDKQPGVLNIQHMLIYQHLLGGPFHMFRLGVFVVVGLSASSRPARAQTATDSAYRAFDRAMSVIRDRNIKQFAISSPSGINEASYVTVGGIEQWVTIRGQDRANPVILFLHGGPGDVTNPWTFRIFAPWEQRFTMVQWDERGAGRTLAKSGPGIAPTITVDRMAQDGIELAEYLRRHLGKPKVILVAHSFGTILALRMVRQRPDLFYAYVGTGQVADETRNYAVAYDALVRKARDLGNTAALTELQRIGPPPYPSCAGYRVQWKWANAFEGADGFLNGTISLTLVAPGGSVEDFNRSEEGEILSADQLVPQTKSARMADLGLSFAIPVFFFQGAEDFTTPTELAHQYLDSLHAPQKAFVPIEGGGHFAVFMRSNQFLKELVERVRPLATGAGR